MLNIENRADGAKLMLALEGRLDTTTAPQLEQSFLQSIDGVTELTLDFTRLDYISSAGLRVLLTMQKHMDRQGGMKLCGVNKTIMEIFEITGFSDILTIV